MALPRPSRIYVLAGVNGAGKSSLGGAAFRASGADYYDPVEVAHAVMAANPNLTQADANSAAWHQGVKLLKRAIAERKDFAFETTLAPTRSRDCSHKPRHKASRSISGTSAFPARSFTSNESKLASAAAATTSPPSISTGASSTAGLTLSN